MNYNRNFGKLVDGRLVYAPKFLTADLAAHTDEDYMAAGWMRVDVTLPDPPDGCYCYSSAFAIDGGTIRCVHTYTEFPQDEGASADELTNAPESGLDTDGDSSTNRG